MLHQEGAQTVDDSFQTSGLEAALRLLVVRAPKATKIGEQSPWSADTDNPAQGMEHHTQIVCALWRLRVDQG